MLIDSRPRRMVCVLPSGLPIPILSATLDTLFGRFLSPTIYLLPSSVATTVGAGARSALIVDLGWHESTVTSVYEYREVAVNRTVRGGRMLAERTHKLLASHLPRDIASSGPSAADYLLSFEECNEIATRLVWCKPSTHSPATRTEDDGLPTVQEQDESDNRTHHTPGHMNTTEIPLKSYTSPVTIELSYDQLAEPCENTFFESQYSPSCFDDHETPIHLLVYRTLLQLPMDVRAICMSRIIFTGGGASVLGLRKRIFDEISYLAQQRGWDLVQGKAVEQLRANPLLKKRTTRQASSGPTGVESPTSTSEEQDGVWHDAANTAPEVDPVEEQLKKGRDKRVQVRGLLRSIESLGPWSGASLITQLKAPAVATIDRDVWQQQGAAGASKASDVDPRSQRQSLGPGLMRGSSSTSWTLGLWGAH